MKLLFCFFIFQAFDTLGQSEIGKPIYLNDTLPDGMVVNKLDDNGLQHGLYILPNFHGHTKANKIDFMDMECLGYEKGYYDHGCPVGKWVYVQSNGFRHEGEYHCTIKPEEVSFRNKKGKDFQIGIWTTYNPDSSIDYRRKSTYTFDGKYWTDFLYLQKKNDTAYYLSSSNKYNSNKNRYINKTGVYEDKLYNQGGILTQVKYQSSKIRYIKEYDENGKIELNQTAWYGKKGRKLYIEKKYDHLGRVTKIEKIKGQPKKEWGWCGTRSYSFF